MGATSSSPGAPLPAATLVSSSRASTRTSATPQTNASRKRKNAAPALNTMQHKRIRLTLIDDPVAIAVLSELSLNRQWINSGTLLAWALSPSDPDFINIHDYVERSQENYYGVKILSILRIIPKANSLAKDDAIFDFNLNPKTAGKHRMMLWHGTKVANVPSILQNGLKLPQRGGLFGPGIYFADRVAKSVQYCDYNTSRHGYLFLCDVLLNNVYEDKSFRFHLRSAPRGTQSVKGMGNFIPDPEWDMQIDGCKWPLGRTLLESGNALRFNEYVVYDQAQVQPKYLIKFARSERKATYKLY